MPGKILVVEDNALNMKLILMTLCPYGYSLVGASDGEEALEMAEREKPDIIIMDIQLPGMDGLEVTRRLRKSHLFSHVPIVAVTAYAMKGDEEKILAAGCDAYLAKPINPRQLPGVIAEMLRRG